MVTGHYGLLDCMSLQFSRWSWEVLPHIWPKNRFCWPMQFVKLKQLLNLKISKSQFPASSEKIWEYGNTQTTFKGGISMSLQYPQVLTWPSLTSFCYLPGPSRHSNLKYVQFIVMGLNSSWGNEWLFSPGMASVYLLVYLNGFLHMVELCQWRREKEDATLVTLPHLPVKQLGLIISQSLPP